MFNKEESMFWNWFPSRCRLRRYFQICREGEIETLEYNIANIKGKSAYKTVAMQELQRLMGQRATLKQKLLKRMVKVGSIKKVLKIA